MTIVNGMADQPLSSPRAVARLKRPPRFTDS
jgi:hypothetical protein